MISKQLKKHITIYIIVVNTKDNFKKRVEGVDLKNYFKNEPFRLSGQALYKWSPIAEELKILDKEVVLNSIKNKWNTVTSDFEKLSSKFKI